MASNALTAASVSFKFEILLLRLGDLPLTDVDEADENGWWKLAAAESDGEGERVIDLSEGADASICERCSRSFE